MRHNYKGRKLGTDFSHTKAMKRSLVSALLYNDRIKTIESRAKEIRPDVDRIITWAKKGDLHSRRLAIAWLGGDKELVREVFEKVEQGMFSDRQGGYTRIMKLGPRKGDGAPMVIMELCTERVAKKKDKAGATAEPKKVATPKKIEAAEASAVEEAVDDTLEEAQAIEAEVEEATEVVEAEAEAVEAKVEEAAEAVEEAAPEAVEVAEEVAEKAAE